MATFEYLFPSIRGVQAGREFYASMCPLRLIPKIFDFDNEELRPELRAQRVLNKQRIPEMTRYLVSNPKDYTFSALTASIDAKVKFDALGESAAERSIGTLRVPMSARFIINDGQHRQAAIRDALHENPDLGDETIAVVFFLDVGLKRCQQMFADLNRHAIRPSPSLGLLYDHRDEGAQLAKELVGRVPVFKGLTELEKSTISNRSIKLFTLSGIHNSTGALLMGLDLKTREDQATLRSQGSKRPSTMKCRLSPGAGSCRRCWIAFRSWRASRVFRRMAFRWSLRLSGMRSTRGRAFPWFGVTRCGPVSSFRGSERSSI